LGEVKAEKSEIVKDEQLADESVHGKVA